MSRPKLTIISFNFFSLPALFREATTEFTVDARSLTKKGGDHIKAQVRNPSGALTDCIVTDKADGTYGIEYTPFENGKKLIKKQLPLSAVDVKKGVMNRFMCLVVQMIDMLTSL